MIGKPSYSRPLQYRPSQYHRPLNTAAHFQVPNKGFVGCIWLPTPPLSDDRRFFASPKIGGIGGFDCFISNAQVKQEATIKFLGVTIDENLN